RHKEKRVPGAPPSFRDAWEEEDSASQKQIKDPSPPRPPAQGE
uniref:Uncharacterized protein n=1 Tax=Ictidomys tridecemlineatus TaxID=43179 RepID=A0A287DBQ5_ICTTR